MTMKIIEIDRIVGVADDVLVLSQSMRGFGKLASGSIQKTLVDLAKLLGDNVAWALCGGLAVGVRAKPRGTEDVDIVIGSDAVIDKPVVAFQDVSCLNRFLAFFQIALYCLVYFWPFINLTSRNIAQDFKTIPVVCVTIKDRVVGC